MHIHKLKTLSRSFCLNYKDVKALCTVAGVTKLWLAHVSGAVRQNGL